MERWLAVLMVGLSGVAVLGLRARARRRSPEMRQRLQSEYAHELSTRGRKAAENELIERDERIRHYAMHPLNRAQYDRYTNRWRSIQERFVDDPVSATVVADHLIKEVMETRGYPVKQLERRAADLSIDHPVLFTQYRDARRVVEATRDHAANIEELRHAFARYRNVFDDLVTPSRHSVPPPPHV